MMIKLERFIPHIVKDEDGNDEGGRKNKKASDSIPFTVAAFILHPFSALWDNDGRASAARVETCVLARHPKLQSSWSRSESPRSEEHAFGRINRSDDLQPDLQPALRERRRACEADSEPRRRAHEAHRLLHHDARCFQD